MADQTNIKRGKFIRKCILDMIIKYIEQHGYAPTIREIGEAVGLKSTSSVMDHIRKMLAEGTLETDAGPGSPRALRVPGYRFVKRTREVNLRELYETDSDFRRYVDRYCQNYIEGRSITVEEALTHKLVRAYAEEKALEKQGKAV